jgi:hypothetical protein
VGFVVAMAVSHASAKAGQNPIQIFEPKGSGFP